MSERMSWFEFVRSDAPTPRTFINEAVVPEREVQSARERADRRWHMNEERRKDKADANK
jgi:hypothetical protein